MTAQMARSGAGHRFAGSISGSGACDESAGVVVAAAQLFFVLVYETVEFDAVPGRRLGLP
ncbi:hypothetical protein [Nocardia stercoris]|uniref:Uncharacterized protein n=1 Tax=Nocardia stercoris TaxID=2483361 RepID=A0A3M2KTB3_9NOCA|nr:hypothetical protein [Nocardia stercoris]RMI28174.1 hypothetical protein EBN03_31235 [Nocardia stercoris]